MAPTIFINSGGFVVHSNPNNMTLWLLPEKSMKLEKYILIFYSSPNVAPKPAGQFCSNSLSRVLLQISPGFLFINCRLTLKIKGSSLKKQANELRDKHGDLQT